MDYIVMDLEWNQGGDQAGASTETAEKLTFEVIEIGAVKVENGVLTGHFQMLVKPQQMQIGQAVGLKSPATVHGHLRALEEKGYIKRDSCNFGRKPVSWGGA